jgi:hypothetical protein
MEITGWMRLKSRPFALVDCQLHRLPAKRGRALRAVGISAARGFGPDQEGTAQHCLRESDPSFAVCCGTHLFFEDGEDSNNIDVTIASLDDPTPFPPQKSVFLEDEWPWVVSMGRFRISRKRRRLPE